MRAEAPGDRRERDVQHRSIDEGQAGGEDTGGQDEAGMAGLTARSDDGSGRTERVGQCVAHAPYNTSNSPAAPMPPPMHIVTITYFAPRRLPSIRAWPVIRAPDMP